jgi:hypothetical protein
MDVSSSEATGLKSKLGPTKKELTLCDFLRKQKETLTGDVTLSESETKAVASLTGVVKRKLQDPAESSVSAGKRKKKDVEHSISSEAEGTCVSRIS